MNAKAALTLEGFAVPRARKGQAKSAVPPAPDEDQAKAEKQGADQEPDPTPSRSQPGSELVKVGLAAVLDDLAPPPEVETRTTVSTRLTLAMQERMRIFAFQTRMRKQDIIDAALDEFLTKRGR